MIKKLRETTLGNQLYGYYRKQALPDARRGDASQSGEVRQWFMPKPTRTGLGEAIPLKVYTYWFNLNTLRNFSASSALPLTRRNLFCIKATSMRFFFNKIIAQQPALASIIKSAF